MKRGERWSPEKLFFNVGTSQWLGAPACYKGTICALIIDIQTCITKREQLYRTRAIAFKRFGRIICQLHIISDNNLFTLVTSFLLFLQPTACWFDILPMSTARPKQQTSSVFMAVMWNLSCNYKLWLIRTNIIIYNDKSPLLRINLNFPERSGTFRRVPAALHLPFRQNPDNKLISGKIRSGKQKPVPIGS